MRRLDRSSSSTVLYVPEKANHRYLFEFSRRKRVNFQQALQRFGPVSIFQI